MGSNTSRANNAVFEVVPWETLQDLDFDADLDLEGGTNNNDRSNGNGKIHIRPPSRKKNVAIQMINTNKGFAMFYPELVQHVLRKKRRRRDSKSSNRFRFRVPTAESGLDNEDPTTILYKISSYHSPTIFCNPSEEESDSDEEIRNFC